MFSYIIGGRAAAGRFAFSGTSGYDPVGVLMTVLTGLKHLSCRLPSKTRCSDQGNLVHKRRDVFAEFAQEGDDYKGSTRKLCKYFELGVYEDSTSRIEYRVVMPLDLQAGQ